MNLQKKITISQLLKKSNKIKEIRFTSKYNNSIESLLKYMCSRFGSHEITNLRLITEKYTHNLTVINMNFIPC